MPMPLSTCMRVSMALNSWHIGSSQPRKAALADVADSYCVGVFLVCESSDNGLYTFRRLSSFTNVYPLTKIKS